MTCPDLTPGTPPGCWSLTGVVFQSSARSKLYESLGITQIQKKQKYKINIHTNTQTTFFTFLNTKFHSLVDYILL